MPTTARLRRIAVLLLFLSLPLSIARAQPARLAELDAYIEQAVSDWGMPGLAVAVVQHDSVVFARGYGVREWGREDPVDPHTLFAVASNTKAFTAAMLGMLVQEGRLGWDDRVVDHLPRLQLYDPFVTRDVRVRDLLTHRTGLPTFGGDQLWIGASLSRDEILARLRYLAPDAPFRTRFQYNNLMFLVAGELIPAVTDTTWDDFLRVRIFEPLGMAEATSSVTALAGRTNVATPHETVGGKLTPIAYDQVDGIAPAGGINANVLDMVRWMRLNLNGGRFEGRQLLNPGIVREMQSVQIPLSVYRAGNEVRGYGLGWFVGDYHGRKMVQHSGGLSGMGSLQTLLPEEELGVVILSNYIDNYASLPQALTDRILDAFLNREPRDWAAEQWTRRRQQIERVAAEAEVRAAERIPNTVPSHPLEAYTGTYAEPFSGEATIRLEDGHLVFDYNPRYVGDLEHWHYDTFLLTWRHPIFDMAATTLVTFDAAPDGTVDAARLSFYDPITFTRVRD